MIIAGAGLTGLIAGALSRAIIYEKAPAPSANHRALLRFRSDSVARAIGIPFRKVRVRKGIWMDGRFHDPSIRLSNMYSHKVIGRLEDRSIWDIAPSDRWVAPESLYEHLVEMNRIEWGADAFLVPRKAHSPEPFINTVPLSVILKRVTTKMGFSALPEFNYAPINVRRYRINNANVHQTIYFPSPDTAMYRASITGDLLIIESMGDRGEDHDWDMDNVISAFDLTHAEPIDSSAQSFGKISPIPEDFRRAVITMLSRDHGIYSLGRFATWRNILLDDIPGDFDTIKRLIHSDDYDRRRTDG